MIDLFKRWFSRSKEQDIDDSQNPWAGLASYEDPETTERKLKFCGRDDDSYDLARLIMGNVFVTLYGKSGIGKTSLINAGVFPELREEQYTPGSIRLGMRDEEHPQSYQTMIVEAVKRVVKRTETINVIDEQQDQQSIDYLWNYFARHRFYDKYDKPITPVIVFDQFEEVFRGHRNEAETLLRQLDYLNDKDHTLDSCEVDSQPYRYEQNFRFIVSIREDDLYCLEDSIDNCYLPALKRCRYRLRSLSEQSAEAVILVPGEGLFKKEEQKGIVDTIINIARNKDDQSISTNVLSLICSRIFVDFQKSGADYITPTLVDTFIKGNPFERFYNEATRGFSNKEKSYIEDNLVDSTGRRNSIPESNFLLHVPKGKQLLEGDTRILQRISTSSDGGNHRIELIHDSFCEPLSMQKEKREKRRRLWQFLGIISVAILSIAFIVYILGINYKMNLNMSRVLAEKANQLTDNGDSYLARLIALQALPPNLPYTIEAESALRKACQYENGILRGHSSYVRCAKFSPDGNLIVSASSDKTVRVWDSKTGKCLKILKGHINTVFSVAFSPDGNKIASASSDNTIRVWNSKTGKCLKILKGHINTVLSAAFSPDGMCIISASDDNTIRIWNAKTGECIATLKGHDSWLNSAVCSPNGKYIVSASHDHTIRIWDAKTGICQDTLTGHTKGVKYAAFSSDSKQIVSASADSTIRIWDVRTGKCLNTLKGHTFFVNYAIFSPNSKQIVSASSDNTIRIWDVNSGDCKKIIAGHTNSVNTVDFSQNGMFVVSASDDKIIRLWNIHSEHNLHNTMKVETERTGGFTFSPDSKFVVMRSNGKLIILNVYTGECIDTFDTKTSSIRDALFSPDGQIILSASDDKTISNWDTRTGKCLKKIERYNNSFYSAAFSPNGKRIVSMLGGDSLSVWDVSTGNCLYKLAGHTNTILSVCFSPNGKQIVSASHDKTVRIWDANSGKCINILKHPRSVSAVSCSPDGQQIVSASYDENNIYIWDSRTGKCLETLEGHTDGVYSVGFSHNGKMVISSSGDHTVRIWDALTGICLQVLNGHTASVNFASFSPDGKRIVSVSNNDHTVRIWDFSPLQQLIDETRERFKKRRLTDEERRKYYLEY